MDEEFSTSGDLDIQSDSLTLFSLPGAHPIIRQQTQDRILDIHPSAADVVITGPMTLQGGEAFSSGVSERGGSIDFFRGKSLTLTDVHFVGGCAPDAGGCLSFQAPVTPGSLSLLRVSFTDCLSEGVGGGFAIEPDDSTVHLDRVSVRGNRAAEQGGGGFIQGASSTVVIERSTFEDNSATATFNQDHQGGGLFLADGNYWLLESTFAHNTVGQVGGTTSRGGGLFLDNASLLLRNATLSQNSIVWRHWPPAPISRLEASSAGLEFLTLRADETGLVESVTDCRLDRASMSSPRFCAAPASAVA